MAMEMEEDLSSMVSNAGTTRQKRIYQAEASVSSITGFLVQESKRLSHGSSNLSANTKFKGVVLQQNGHWGAQIYANHNRVWLGTFNSEVDAAMAYDSAAIKLRNGECQRNFAWTKVTDQEPYFQNLYSQEAVLNMIKDGTYQARFLEFRMSHQAAESMQKIGMAECNSARVQQSKRDILHKQLFQKELTPSDVGKLNRLVIPKNYATKYFPRIDESMQEGLDDNPAPDVQLSFYDENMRPWKFRYCYWKSSQSFVFTRGWNRFVKESLLKANDIIRFYECHIREGDKEAKSFYMIKIDRAESSDVIVENAGLCVSPALTPLHAKKFGEEKDDIKTQIAEVIDETPQVNGDNKRIRLFGVCMVVGEN
ncbi:putative transcription factor RAV family [Rosa chinensis]|uniref:Putative transcription factor RAV family n=1 Tax=Rosa chinensis TaxID=74649 RepID=A0A2P6QE40_ROSCH|nr:AP2/ERF and B3 domain-containing transcription factor At1g50680 [Rosa chinensis]PRQ32458.1 putative transcription factor RAV family [Rosa chinensis]